MTKEEKRRREHNEYMKWWNRHKGKESYKEYQRNYHKEYREKHKGYYIYFFVDENGDIAYIGKTLNLKNRMAQHKCYREVYEDNFTVLYKEFKNINDDILYDLEQSLIDICRPRLNKECADYDCSVDKYLGSFNLKEYKM